MSAPITFVSWRWKPNKPDPRFSFSPSTVYALRDMIVRFYDRPHRFVCITDEPDALPGIETIRLWDDCSRIPSRFGHSYPSCYRRLKVFAPDAAGVCEPGSRLVSMDLDTVIVGNLVPLFDRPEDFVIWGESDYPHTTPYCGALWMLRTGTRTKVWTQFDEKTSPDLAWSHGCRGSDQGWIAFVLGRNEATWTRRDGVYSWRKHIRGGPLPKDARVTCWHGKENPWDKRAQRHEWVRRFYPMQVAA